MDEAHAVVRWALTVHHCTTVLIHTANADTTYVITCLRIPDEVNITPALLQHATGELHAEGSTNDVARKIASEDVAVEARLAIEIFANVAS